MSELTRYPSYKDSGVPWLGEIPSHWHIKRLKFAISNISQKVDAQSSSSRYFGLENIESFTGKLLNKIELTSEGVAHQFEKNDVLFGKLRPYLAKVYLAKTEGLSSTEALIFRPSSEIAPKFLFYYCLSQDFINEVNGTTFGSKMPRANWDNISSLAMVIPSLDEQKSLTDFLDAQLDKIDAIIYKQKILLNKLEEQRLAIITNAVTKGLDHNVPMQSSYIEGLEELPLHWQIKRLKFMAKIKNGSDYKHIISDEGYPVIGSGGEFATASEYLYKGESVLLGRKGTIDRPLYVNCAFWTVDTMYYTEINEHTFPKYLFYCSLTIDFWKYSTQTALPSMTQTALSNLLFAVPEYHEQELIAKFLDAETSKIDAISLNTKSLINTLKEYRSALITQAVTGKIDVRGFNSDQQGAT